MVNAKLSLDDKLSGGLIPLVETGCIVWFKGNDKDGYGLIGVDGSTKRVHRLVWELSYGEIPRGMFVCHSCDTPSCANIDHLFLGTPKDNMADKVSKNRHSNGNDRKTVCRNGHNFNYVEPKSGKRRCTICDKNRAIARRGNVTA